MLQFSLHYSEEASPSSSCTMNVVLIGLQCQFDSPSPSVSTLRQMVQFLQCIFAPVLSLAPLHSLCGLRLLFFPSIHYSEHRCLKFPAVTHSGNVSIVQTGSFYALLLVA